MHVLIIFILIVSLVLCRIQSQEGFIFIKQTSSTGSTGPTSSTGSTGPEQEFRQKQKMIEAEMIKAGMTQANISEALKAMLEVYMTEAGMTEEQKKIPRAMHEFTEMRKMQKMQTTPPSAQMQTTPPVQAPLYNVIW